MGNYIKIPLAINPPRSLVTGTGSLTASITTNSTDATNQAATNTAFTTSGTGTGATVQLTIAGNAVTVASTTVAGEGFKVGDTLTFDKSVIGGTTDVVITLVADDLVTSDGSATNNYQLIDIDRVITVDGYSTSINIFQKIRNEISGTPVQNIQLELDNAPSVDFGLALRAVSDAMVKAIQSPNSLPVVDWGNSNVEVLTVDQT